VELILFRFLSDGRRRNANGFQPCTKSGSPWRIKEFKIFDRDRVVDVYIDYEEKSSFSCS
jgi:hypothetical protein